MLFTSYEILLIKRFLFSKKTDGFISIFSWFSIIGITIGVAAIIIVMSVMNGFREELTLRLLGINGHLNIYSQVGQITNEEVNIIKSDFSSNQVIPLIQTQALVISKGFSKGVFLRGYDSDDLDAKHFLRQNIIEGKLFGNNINDIVIGYVLANKFGLSVGDKIKIAIPKTDNTIFGNIPRFKTLSISGILDLGMYEYDSNFVFSHISIARKLLVLEDRNFNLVEIFIQSPNNIEIIQDKVDRRIIANNINLYTLSWKENNSSLINALKVEKNVMFIILTLIILVASMNIISGLIIFVKEKNKDIGILKTIGLNNKSLIKVFLSIGLVIGLIGTIIGGLVGVIFSFNIKSIQLFIENLLQTDLFSKEIYYLSNLPSRINNLEVIYVLIISITICLIATTIPAYRSMKVDPIKSLKND